MRCQELGDHIGAESCVDFRPDAADIVSDGGARTNPPRRQRRTDAAEKEYPPSIPSHMPWVMKRYSTSDGGLVIREEKVRLRQYFQAHRSGGRLLLNLVPLDDGDGGGGGGDGTEEDFEVHLAGDEGEENFPENVAVHGEEIDGGDEGMNDPTAEEVHSGSVKYNGVGVKQCGGFGVAVAGFRPPVQT